MRGLLYKAFSAMGQSKVSRIEADSHAPREAQLRKLNQIVSENASTRFGREHGFGAVKTWEDFNKAVKIRDYEGFRGYIEDVMAGADSVLTVEKPQMFATTSGTTDKPKFIPITPGYIKEFREASVVSGFHLLRTFPNIAHGTALVVTSPAEEGKTASGIPYGSMSGSLFKNEPFLVKKYISPVPYEVFLIKDYESKYYALLRAALSLPVAVFYTLNPSTIQLMCRKLQHHAEQLIKDVRDGTTTAPVALDNVTLNAIKAIAKPDAKRARELATLLENDQFTPEKIWPTLQVVSCWTKAAAAFYLSDFPKYFGNLPICDITYGASEGRGTVFLSPEKQMLAINSHFFEFVPEDEMESANPTVLLADQLEVGQNYFILFTTSAGLYRYNINDVVKVTGYHNRTPLLDFQYKGGNICSFTGEKITELQVTESMQAALNRSNSGVRFFTVIPQFRPEPHYELWIEPEATSASDNDSRQGELLTRLFDEALCQHNIEYETKRASARLGSVTFRTIKRGTYEAFREHLTSRGTPDTQIKISHLNPKSETMDFLSARLLPEETFVESRK